MTDRRLRILERAYKSSNEWSDLRALLRAQLRAGVLVVGTVARDVSKGKIHAFYEDKTLCNTPEGWPNTTPGELLTCQLCRSFLMPWLLGKRQPQQLEEIT